MDKNREEFINQSLQPMVLAAREAIRKFIINLQQVEVSDDAPVVALRWSNDEFEHAARLQAASNAIELMNRDLSNSHILLCLQNRSLMAIRNLNTSTSPTENFMRQLEVSISTSLHQEAIRYLSRDI